MGVRMLKAQMLRVRMLKAHTLRAELMKFGRIRAQKVLNHKNFRPQH